VVFAARCGWRHRVVAFVVARRLVAAVGRVDVARSSVIVITFVAVAVAAVFVVQAVAHWLSHRFDLRIGCAT
jgi:hypothetical protein